MTFALSKADLNLNLVEEDNNKDYKDKLDTTLRAQNQVVLMATCELEEMTDKDKNICKAKSKVLPNLVIATTHLKAAKSEKGEKFRLLEVQQLMSALEVIVKAQEQERCYPLVLLTGDLNAAPDARLTDYPAHAYAAVKEHPLCLRSVRELWVMFRGLFLCYIVAIFHI